MTVLELINALENARGGYDDPVEIIRPPIGREPERFEIVDFRLTVYAGDGTLQLILSRK